jgi:translation elongation factor EF-Tu-like GTPase
MAWFRRKDDESLDPQVLLAKANAETPAAVAMPTASFVGTGFRMTVGDVFTIRQRGTVVTGTIEAGAVTKGQTVRLTRQDGAARDVRVDGVEMFRKVVETASAGDTVGLLLRGLERDDIGKGDVLTA